MTCIKCRLSSYLFFSDSRLLFNKSLTSTALWTLQEYVRNWSLCVPLRAELNAIVRKLIPLICFDIFQSNRNALIANTFFGTPIKAFRYHFDLKMSKLISLICFDIFQSKWHRNALIANAIFGTPNKRQQDTLTKVLRIGSALRQGEVKTLQHSDYTMCMMVLRQSLCYIVCVLCAEC